MEETVSEPMILTANTYFWSARGNASDRRRSEERRIGEVATWFQSLGMDVTFPAGGCEGSIGYIEAVFYYSESFKNVYRHLRVTVGGQNSNITALRKLADPDSRQKLLDTADRRVKKASFDLIHTTLNR